MSAGETDRKVDDKRLNELIQKLGDEDSDVRRAAAVALREIGDARAVEPLIRALGDKHSDVRWAAAVALREIGDARAVEPLIRALRDEDSGVRRAAAVALRKISEAQPIPGPPPPPPQIFLCYAREDKEKVRAIHDKLKGAGFAPWWDEDLLPGQRWENVIDEAIERSDLFLACLSVQALSKEKAYYRKEIEKALEIADMKHERAIFLIPVRLDDCEVPKKLSAFQWVNWFEEDGFEKLVKAIEAEVERREWVLKGEAR